MSVVLSEHLPLLASAPDGIKKLRGLILELAVRGKLVPQDPDDEPASELLKRIARNRARQSSKALKPLRNDCPFKLPDGWAWVMFGDIAEIERGGSPRPIKSYLTDDPDGLNWIKIGDTDKGGKYITAAGEKIRREGLSKTRMVYPGDFLLTNSMSFGRPYITQIEGCIHDGWLRIGPHRELDKDYLYSLLSSPFVRKLFVAAAAGAVVMNLNADKVRDLPIALPPLAEQHRIVAKVDELMALCDRLEAEQADAASAHARLVETLLGTLTQSTDADDLSANWQRLARNFDILFETPSAIAALRKTILNLAVYGRLVQRSAPAETCALSTLIDGDSLNGYSKRPSDTARGVQILRISAGTGNDDFFIDEEDHKWVEATPAEVDKFRLLPDDLLACRFNGNLHYVGSFSLYRGQSAAPQIFPDKLIRFRVRKHKVLANYLRYALNADPVRVQVESFCATTVGNIGISAGNLKTVRVRVPELDEQHRIVAKVDELMALCDLLKADLTTARQQQARLADTLIESALEAA